ncbi:hypothetical protein F0562_018910 [Nyssa sinensis]|uniref:Uncharacterized protein n=1 Tax=Nyssa sinensis TaxID=561372 RepID=A0A5J4ZC62_9ASTE|nr:hypothetical protein F0562_018910 [Nyssa sinensis]
MVLRQDTSWHSPGAAMNTTQPLHLMLLHIYWINNPNVESIKFEKHCDTNVGCIRWSLWLESFVDPTWILRESQGGEVLLAASLFQQTPQGKDHCSFSLFGLCVAVVVLWLLRVV